MTINFPNLRHMRKRHFSRTRYGKRVIDFGTTEAARLLASATGQVVSVQHTSNVDAVNTGTIGTNPSAAEFITFGSQVYTFKSAITEVKASCVLTSSANFADTETVTIGSKVYTFQASLTNVDGHVKIGASEGASLTNLHHAINASGGTVGTDYATLTTANSMVTAADDATHTVTVTAILPGVAGNSVVTTETSATASWAHPTLISGVDPIPNEVKIGVAATNTRDNLVHGVNQSSGTVGTDYSTGTVNAQVTLATSSTAAFTVTAKAHGVAGNGIALAHSTAHITFNPASTAATAVLTSSANYSNGETFTLGGKLYTLQSILTDYQGHIKIGTTEALTMANIAAAVTGSGGGTAGTDYAFSNSADPNFTATTDASHAVTFTARVVGTASNSIATTETSATAAFGATKASGGLDQATAGGVTEDWVKLTATSHTFQEDEGPYVLTAGTTIPGGYAAGQKVFIDVIDNANIRLKPTRSASTFVHFTDTGTGTLTLTKAATGASIFEMLRGNSTQTIRAASDIDTLA